MSNLFRIGQYKLILGEGYFDKGDILNCSDGQVKLTSKRINYYAKWWHRPYNLFVFLCTNKDPIQPIYRYYWAKIL